MKKLVTLDVLVVYSAGLATSASVADTKSKHPFLLNSKQANYNLAYAYFLEACKDAGLTAGLTTSLDVIGPGMCSNYWTFVSGKWVKKNNYAQSLQVFDKISPVTLAKAASRRLLLSDETIQPFNDVQLFDAFFDKLRTYQEFPDCTLPTVDIRSSHMADIKAALKKLHVAIDKHNFPDDFAPAIVLKDQFGAGGDYVYKITNNFAERIQKLMQANKQVHFVIQPFLSFDTGYVYKNNHTSTDLRLIFHHDQLLQCYVRMAKARDFRCNEHQGGQLEYVTAKDIPDSVHEMASDIVSVIDKPQSLYALDFVVSNSGRVYFIEGNTGPGIDWDVSKKVNEEMSKQLIESIVKEFALRIRTSPSVQPQLVSQIEAFDYGVIPLPTPAPILSL